MAEETVRWPGGWARLGPWRGHHDIAYLAFGVHHPPSSEVVNRCLARLARRGFTSVVTNALGVAETLPLVDAGFSVHERLHLLAHDLADIPAVCHETRRARAADRRSVLVLDHRAFQSFWQLDDDSMTSAINATPTTRMRIVDASPDAEIELGAYAITGRSARKGYLQRVAVDPAVHGQGIGRSVVADALRWLRRHRTERALVNTQFDNEAAMGLYRSCGFRELPLGLRVMGREL